ncbi:MAG TPA: HAD family hydrolase [Verrucomicrobiae bacterium]
MVFDFDNTLICGDIGEATLAVLARCGVLTPATVPKHLCPAFRAGGKRLVRIESCADVTEYYEALLEPTSYGARDPQPLATGYAWVVQAMENLKLADVVRATRAAFEWSDPAHPGFIDVTPGRTAYPVPFFYPEMIELLAELLRHRFDVWIVSASNVWSVRWVMLKSLNPLLRQCGVRTGLCPDHVIGISTLLVDRRNRLCKDAVLVREDDAYAQLDKAVLSHLRLTSVLHYPVPTYAGKIAAIFDCLGRNPYLVAGDSPGDLPMLAIAAHRLWIARLTKPQYQRTALEWFRQSATRPWLVQPTLASRANGFLPYSNDTRGLLPIPTQQVRLSLELLAPAFADCPKRRTCSIT